jgi:required for meiotic nuclear division protein 1
VCFVDFNENEIRIFLQYMDSIIGCVDFFLFSKFNENHFGNAENAHAICFILAKSVELNKLEADLEDMFDKSERLLDFLQSGKLHINRKLILSASRILRLEYHYANNVGIFERDLSTYYELDERQKVIQSKMDDMRNIFNAYSSFSYNQRESRTLWFEIALLSLFPTSYVLEIIPYRYMISRLLRVIFP